MFSSNTTQIASAEANWIEECFQSWLYTGNGSTQTITNGIDLSTYGGLWWGKGRSNPGNLGGHGLVDTVRGKGKMLQSNTTGAQFVTTGDEFVTSFNTNGVTIGNDNTFNRSAELTVGWTFRKQPKFFDVVTYTGNGSSTQTINHNLGSTPGCIIIKVTSQADDWYVYHRSLSQSGGVPYWLNLNSTAAQQFFGGGIMLSADPTSTTFTVKGGVNGSGNTYVAYVFAHNAGGFGLTGTDNVITCGSFTSTSGGAASVTLGYEPQWLLIKRSSGADNWYLIDNMRGYSYSQTASLVPNSSAAEDPAAFLANPTATGFEFGTGTLFNSSTYIYIAIRRGPMKVPTDATKVFSPNVANATTGTPLVTNFPVDLSIAQYRLGEPARWQDKLRGVNSPNYSGVTPSLRSDSTAAEASSSYTLGWDNTQIQVPAYYASVSTVWWNMRRAPSFFDEVCYTGTGSATTINHNLGVAPELMIIKKRSSATNGNWAVYSADRGNTSVIFLNLTNAVATSQTTYWNSTSPTSTVFTVGTNANLNSSSDTFVAYLFATCAGISKVGSYTGTGTTLQINCGFTAGSRFVLIKRTDSTGDWYVWDSARGIVAGNDPYLLLNSTAAEVTTTDYIDTYSAGFEISSTAPAAINASGGTFIFLAIA